MPLLRSLQCKKSKRLRTKELTKKKTPETLEGLKDRRPEVWEAQSLCKRRTNLFSNSPKVSQKATGTSTQQPLLFAEKLRLMTSPPKSAPMNGEKSTNMAMSSLRRSGKKKRTSSKSSSSRSKMPLMSRSTLKSWKKTNAKRKPRRKIKKYLRQRAKD